MFVNVFVVISDLVVLSKAKAMPAPTAAAFAPVEQLGMPPSAQAS